MTESFSSPSVNKAAGLVTNAFSRRQLFRLGAGISASAAVAATLAACTPSGGTKAGSSSGGGGGAARTITIWEFYSQEKPLLPNGQWWRDIVATWNKQNSQVRVDDHYVTNADYSSGTALATAFASGTGPDVFLVSSGEFLKYYNGGVLADLTPHLTKAQIDDYAPGILDTRMVDGKIYGLAMEVAPIAFYYSQKAFEDAHLSESDIPKTWEELLDVGAKLTTKSRFGLLFDTTPGPYQNFTWYPFMWMNGGQVTTPDGKKSAFGSAEVAGALALWQEATQRKIAPRQVQGTNGSDLASNLLSGFCAIQECGAWAIQQGTDAQKKSTPYGLFKLPAPKAGAQSITDLGGWCLAVNAKSKHLDDAIKFAIWATASMTPSGIQRAAAWATAAGDISTRLSARKATTNQPKELAWFQNEAAPGGKAEPRFPAQVVQAISDAIQDAQLKGVKPQVAASNASKKIDAFLAGYNGAPIA